MNWNYNCPKCGVLGFVPWLDRNNTFNCYSCKQDHTPPSPSQQTNAYVETHEWPSEMESTVIELKGKKCTVPNCPKNAETLDHRLAYSKNGKTSVNNLFPMCNHHNQSKGDTDYNVWLFTL